MVGKMPFETGGAIIIVGTAGEREFFMIDSP
jgi:hypothetical protein